MRKHEKIKSKKKDKKLEKKKGGKKGKEGPKRYPPRRLKKYFFERNVTRNLEAIEAKNTDFEQPRKEKEQEK